MAMEFERSAANRRPIGLTSLIDVVFILLFFFMLTTSFVRTESMELSFPRSTEVKEKVAAGGIQIFLFDDNRIFLGEKEMSIDDLKSELRLMLFNEPARSILLLSADKVSVQRLVNVMDDVYLMGGKNVAVAQWDPAKGGPNVEEPIEAEAVAEVTDAD